MGKIHLTLTEDRTVINDTVKIIVSVNALAEKPMEQLTKDILAVLNDFIDADWTIYNVNRMRDAAGYENISLNASTRVSETENTNLHDRMEEVSTKGLRLSCLVVDTSMPASKIDEAEDELRMALLDKAVEVAKKYGQHLDQEVAIKELSYSTLPRHSQQNTNSVYALAAASNSKVAYGSGFTSDSETLGNAVKFTMTADLTLLVQ